MFIEGGGGRGVGAKPTPKIDYAKSVTTTKKTIKLQPLHSITALGLSNVITGMTKK